MFTTISETLKTAPFQMTTLLQFVQVTPSPNQTMPVSASNLHSLHRHEALAFQGGGRARPEAHD